VNRDADRRGDLPQLVLRRRRLQVLDDRRRDAASRSKASVSRDVPQPGL
jgi:hypothetical protein